MNCDELTNQQWATAVERGICSESPPASNAADIPPPSQTAVSGAGIPLPLLAIGAVAALTWGLQNASDWGRTKRLEKHRPQGQLAGGYVGQDALYPSSPDHENPVTSGVPVGSGSKTALIGSDGFYRETGYSEPSPWAMNEAQKSNYTKDRTASETTTGDLWLILKDCSFAEFQKRIAPGNVDPVPVVNEGIGGIAAGDALRQWFCHGITQQNKACWGAFGTDGKGGGTTAKAAVQLYKEHLAEWSTINVRG